MQNAILDARNQRPTRLHVVANVGGVAVTINNDPIGQVPIELEVQPGNYLVKGSREGFRDSKVYALTLDGRSSDVL